MPIELIEGSLEHVPQIYDCSWRAFRQDALHKVVFPIADDDVEGLEKLRKFRLQRLIKRLSKPGCHLFIVIDKGIENGSRVLGYAAWHEEALFGNSAAEKNLDDQV